MLKLSSLSSAVNRGTLRWEAPELLDGSQEHTTILTDIYAFACVCYEVSYRLYEVNYPNYFVVIIDLLWPDSFSYYAK